MTGRNISIQRRLFDSALLAFNKPLEDEMESLSRRAVISAIPAVAAIAALPAVALASPDDPIFALIEEHRVLHAEYLRLVDISAGTNDDAPEYNAANEATDQAFGRAEVVAWRLVEVPPATAAGAAALLRYVCATEYDKRGRFDTIWPDYGAEDVEARFVGERPFKWWVMHNAATALASLQSGA
jgi:hypothetical protein